MLKRNKFINLGKLQSTVWLKFSFPCPLRNVQKVNETINTCKINFLLT